MSEKCWCEDRTSPRCGRECESLYERDRYRDALEYIAGHGTADADTEYAVEIALDLDQPWPFQKRPLTFRDTPS